MCVIFSISQLVKLLVESERADSIVKSVLCGISGILPSELREDLMRCLQKLHVCLGTQHASSSALRALFSGDYPVNGVVSGEAGKMTFVTQLQEYALAGDWKRFKNIVKTLSRG